jgi:hypothetical protein
MKPINYDPKPFQPVHIEQGEGNTGIKPKSV